MLDFIDYLGLPFVQRMLLAGILTSLACGVIGTIVVVRRSVFITDGIAHSTFGGVGFAYYMQSLGLTWFDPMLGGVMFAAGAALLLSMETMRKRFREDSTIGVVWVLGMALGILFLNMVDRSKVLVQSPESILFGNILLIGRTDLLIMGGLLIAIYAFTALLFKDLEALTFDEEFARITGIKVGRMNVALLIMVALTATILIKVVGVVLIIAMLTIPAAIANHFTKRLSLMMLSASCIGVVLTTAGNLLSIELDLPPGATIVMLMVLCFLATLLGKSLFRRVISSRAERKLPV